MINPQGAVLYHASLPPEVPELVDLLFELIYRTKYIKINNQNEFKVFNYK